jgi:hypothetical protein
VVVGAPVHGGSEEPGDWPRTAHAAASSSAAGASTTPGIGCPKPVHGRIRRQPVLGGIRRQPVLGGLINQYDPRPETARVRRQGTQSHLATAEFVDDLRGTSRDHHGAALNLALLELVVGLGHIGKGE